MKNIVVISLWSMILISCQSKQEPETAHSSSEPPLMETNEKSDRVSSIELVDLEGAVINLGEYKGKTVFLNFWATWCRPCIAEMPSIVRAQEELGTEEYVFLLASDESAQRITRFKDLQDFPLNFVKLESGFMSLGITSIPTTYVIDRKGEIVMEHTGSLAWDSPEMIEKLKGFAHADQ